MNSGCMVACRIWIVKLTVIVHGISENVDENFHALLLPGRRKNRMQIFDRIIFSIAGDVIGMPECMRNFACVHLIKI
ncbi:hypothetical protein HEAR0991 [Herminiimonas arsenicoxydans]|uniref:Uncharacterized protein n=1 Tax=Herminiimonas arsenicoxydans TaxID=204773 RepID=A4G3T6_HERAR|nr:hypothetical protein HEAR0991 [Herminiimonas arsenicoxydans]